MLDVEQLLRSKNISFRDSGSNVSTGNVNICCPFCFDDPSYHLGINLDTGYWGCWRDVGHRGKTLRRLLKALGWSNAELNVLFKQLEEIKLDDWMLSVTNLESIQTQEQTVKTKLEFPEEFKLIKSQGVYGKFYNYLEQRGLSSKELINSYELKACLTGWWKDRIIIPIHYKNELVTWIGRSIVECEKKYLVLNNEKSLVPIKSLVYNFDFIKYGGNTLFVTEGVFDCINLKQHLPKNCQTTCLFSKVMTTEQEVLISQLSSKYRKIKIMLDSDAEAQAHKIQSELSFLKNVSIQWLPSGVKDPGELTKKQINQLT